MVVVPGVIVPAEAVIVHVVPSEHATPLTVVKEAEPVGVPVNTGLEMAGAMSVAVVSVEPEIVAPEIVGPVVIATLPEPLTVYSPTIPALSKRTFVEEPAVITVVPEG